MGSGHGGDGLGSDSVISKVVSNQRDSVIPWFSLIQHTLVGESICDDCSEASSCLLPSPSLMAGRALPEEHTLLYNAFFSPVVPIAACR